MHREAQKNLDPVAHANIWIVRGRMYLERLLIGNSENTAQLVVVGWVIGETRTGSEGDLVV